MRRRWTLLVGGGLFLAALAAWAGRVFLPPEEPPFPPPELAPSEATGPVPTGSRQATFGCGCFWRGGWALKRLS